MLAMVVDKVMRMSRLVETEWRTSSEMVMGLDMMVSRSLSEALARIIWIDVFNEIK